MARFKLTVSCEFDSAYPITCHTDIARNIVNMVCPQNFSLDNSECARTKKCTMTTCWNCWLHALEGGVVSGDESVHVERLG